MNDFLEQTWWGNPVKNYLAVLGVIIFVLVFKRFISRYFAGLLFRLVNRIWKNLQTCFYQPGGTASWPVFADTGIHHCPAQTKIS
jgi:hypothetical protein